MFILSFLVIRLFNRLLDLAYTILQVFVRVIMFIKRWVTLELRKLILRLKRWWWWTGKPGLRRLFWWFTPRKIAFLTTIILGLIIGLTTYLFFPIKIYLVTFPGGWKIPIFWFFLILISWRIVVHLVFRVLRRFNGLAIFPRIRMWLTFFMFLLFLLWGVKTWGLNYYPDLVSFWGVQFEKVWWSEQELWRAIDELIQSNNATWLSREEQRALILESDHSLPKLQELFQQRKQRYDLLLEKLRTEHPFMRFLRQIHRNLCSHPFGTRFWK